MRVSDPREAAARYRREKDAPSDARPEEDRPAPTARQRAAYVETVIQQAIRRGEFDDLPGAGKPLRGIGRPHDPDWWIRQKIEREGLTGLGPPALLLRGEFAALDARVDDLPTEAEVREALEDFNRRVVEARRQLLGGPPVVTPLVDVDERVSAWRERRDAARAAPARAEPMRARRWWRLSRRRDGRPRRS